MATQAMVRRGPRYGNGFFVPVSLPRLDSIREASRAVYRNGFVKPAKLYAIDKNRLTAGKKDGGALASLKMEMLASPAFAQLAAADVQSFANAITNARELCFFATSREEQAPDGEEDAAQVEALTNPTPDTLRNYVEKAKKARAALDVNIAAAEQAIERMCEQRRA